MSDILFTTFSDKDLSLPFLLYGLGINHTQEPIHRASGLSLYQWIQCVKGNGYLYLDNHEYIITPGQGMFIHADKAHRYHSCSNSEEWIVHFICFKGRSLTDLISGTQFESSGVFSVSEPEVIAQKLESIYRLEPLPPALSSTRYSIALYDILLYLLLYTKTDQGTSLLVQNYKIAPMITYIEANYNKPIVLDELSQVCHISQEYLCELFKKTTGMRIFEFIQCTRIKHSKELLLSMPDLPVHKIGTLCGFNSLSYFIKIFKKLEHLSPGEFRKQNGIINRS